MQQLLLFCILSGGDLNSVEYLSILSTSKISRMLFSLKDWTSGAFMMHEDGEQDTRAVYCDSLSLTCVECCMMLTSRAGVLRMELQRTWQAVRTTTVG